MEGINTAKNKKYINIDIGQNHITLINVDNKEDKEENKKDESSKI